MGNKLTVFQTTDCETVVTKIYNFQKLQEGSIFYLSFKSDERWVQGDIIKVWLEGLWLSSAFNIFKILTLGRISPRDLYLNHFGGAYFYWSRSLKAWKTCLSCIWMAIFP